MWNIIGINILILLKLKSPIPKFPQTLLGAPSRAVLHSSGNTPNYVLSPPSQLAVNSTAGTQVTLVSSHNIMAGKNANVVSYAYSIMQNNSKLHFSIHYKKKLLARKDLARNKYDILY